MHYLESRVYFWSNGGRLVNVVLGKFCCTAVQRGNLLLQMRQGHGVEHCMIRIMCEVRLINRVSTYILQDRVGVLVKIEDMIIQSCLWWYNVIGQDINLQMCEGKELEIIEKRSKSQIKKLWEECVKKNLQWYGLKREDGYNRKKLQEWIKAKIANPASLDNGIKMGVVNLCCCGWNRQF